MAKTRKDIVKILTEHGLSSAQARDFIRGFVDAVGGELLTAGKVRIPRMCVIKMVQKSPRIVRANFITCEDKLLPSRTRPKINYSGQFLAVVKGGANG